MLSLVFNTKRAFLNLIHPLSTCFLMGKSHGYDAHPWNLEHPFRLFVPFGTLTGRQVLWHRMDVGNRFRAETFNAGHGIQAVVSRLPPSTIVKATNRYLHVILKIRLFGFIDDLELKLDPQTKMMSSRQSSGNLTDGMVGLTISNMVNIHTGKQLNSRLA